VNVDMSPNLKVQRLAHVEAFVESVDAELGMQEQVLGTRARWSRSGPGPAGWNSLTWTVPSLADAVDALREHGIRIVEQTDVQVRTHPGDMYGLPLALIDRAGAAKGQSGPRTDASLALVARPVVKVVTVAPDEAAARLAALVGAEPYAVDHSYLNMTGHGVRFADHAVEYVGSATGVATDMAGGFLVRQGPGIFCVSVPVPDLSAARVVLVQAAVRFRQFGRHSLFIESSCGTRIELTDAG